LGQRIFIVDDDEAVRDSVRTLFEAHLFDVEDFESGDDFLARYEGASEGCVVLDINLPGLSGFEVLDRLGGANAPLPVILITGRGGRSVAQRAEAAGATAFLEKPFAGERLLEAVQLALRA
jgi:FixJ family two-component response regulator